MTIVAGTISVVALRWWTTRGHLPVNVPIVLAGVLLALAVLVLIFGLRVRAAVRNHTLDDPVGASRVLVLGQSAAVTAAVHVGYLLAQLGLALPRWEAPEPRAQVLRVVVCLVAALGLAAAGMLTQHFCRVPPEDDDDEQGPRPPGATA
ncbi:DUF3180 domain-containing protein [Ruania zhangjianzhongii]|uniref:DUF3180 domain-containing protein n=1 Tax=Ruania zhangjianzhongii TaxID=2603206 RepID=UPI00143D1B63|nr:DUF3180 domain-containing protein [Ruania zhangjianzhongii]